MNIMSENLSLVAEQIFLNAKNLLIEHGFAKHKSLHVKAINDFSVTIQLVKSPWNSKYAFQFWFEFVIYAIVLPKNIKPSEENLLKTNTCIIKKKMGYVLDDENQFYEINPMINVDQFISNVNNHIQRFINFCYQFNSLWDIIDFLEQENRRLGRNLHSFMIAITLAQLGYKEKSKKFFVESEGDITAIRNWAKYYDIEM